MRRRSGCWWKKGGSKGVIAPQETTFIQNVFEFTILPWEEFCFHPPHRCVPSLLDEPQEAWRPPSMIAAPFRYPLRAPWTGGGHSDAEALFSPLRQKAGRA